MVKEQMCIIVSSDDSGYCDVKKQIERRLKAIDDGFVKLAAALNDGRITTDDFQKSRSSSLEERTALEDKLKSARELMHSERAKRSRVRAAVMMFDSLSENWEQLSLGERMALVAVLVDGLIVVPADDSANIILRFAGLGDVRFTLPLIYIHRQAIGMLEDLSQCELVTAYYLLHGLTPREIAKKFSVNRNAVAVHMHRIHLQSGANTLEEAMKLVEPLVRERITDTYAENYIRRGASIKKRCLRPYETQMLQLIAAGYSHRMIARIQGIPARREICRRRRMIALLGVNNIAEALEHARMRGIVDCRVTTLGEKNVRKIASTIKGEKDE